MRLLGTKLGSISTGRGLGDPLYDTAAAVPSLDLRFAENKSLVDAVSGQNLVTFTRASGGTYLDSAGVLQTVAANEPRFDHDPVTGASLGLLIEGQRVNLLVRSEEFDNASWSKFRCNVTSNTIASPSGVANADSVVATDAGAYVTQVVSGASGTYTFSVYLRAAPGNSSNQVRLRIKDEVNSFQSSPFIQITTEWRRYQFTATAAGAVQSVRLDVPGTALSADHVYIWGAQIEAGAFPTSYIPTSGAVATRNADVADIVQQVLAAGIRTLYVEFRSPAVGAGGVVSLNDNTANERAAINTSGVDPRMVVVDGGVTQADIDAGTIVANARSRMAVRITADNFAASFNGGAVVTDTSGTLPTVDRLFIGRTQAGEYLNAPIARLVGWREELPDSALQALTQ